MGINRQSQISAEMAKMGDEENKMNFPFDPRLPFLQISTNCNELLDELASQNIQHAARQRADRWLMQVKGENF